MRRPITKFSLMAALALSMVACSHNETVVKEVNTKTNENKITYAMSVSPLVSQYIDYKSKNIEVEEIAVKDTRPYIEEVDGKLPSKTLDYIYDESNKADLSYTLMLAMAKVESDFDTQLVSSTSDYGLLQLHKPTAKAIAEEVGVKSYNLKNPQTNIKFSIHYLKQLRDYWRDQGINEEEVFSLTVISYNRGVAGTRSYLKHRSIDDNTYLQKVREWKSKYEQQSEVAS